MRKILNTGRNTPIPMLYSELGCLRIGTILKCKRINFLHYIISSDDDKSLYKFLDIQWKFPNKGDWTETVKQDLKDFKMENNFQKFKNIPKQKFNKIVKIRAKEYEMRYFSDLKSEMSKIRNLQHKKLELANYLNLKEIYDDEAKSIFLSRSRIANFHGNYNTPLKHCPLCFSHPDTQQWSFQCSVLRKNIAINGNYDDILNGKINKKLAKTAKSILKYREMSL